VRMSFVIRGRAVLTRISSTIPNAQSALEASRLYATHPHLAGSVEDFADARTILALFQSELNIAAPPAPPIFPAGSPASQAATRGVPHLSAPSAWIDIYYPILDTPLSHSLDILGADGTVSASFALEEVGDPRDPEAYKYQDAVSAWHGLSADGDVTGRLVYANYGSREDFAELVDRGVNITDKIVLVRYFGALTRGLKVLHAQDLGAAGVLMYSDPRDDGRVTVANGYAPYPAGPARNPSSVQRGTVQFMSTYPGE
jgi:N-acetylated-alpha-linked acidic dipeptidase